MGLSGLDSALSGLRVAQQQLDIISNNVANVSTDGYTRKILPQNTMAVDGKAIGARAGAILRNVDLNLERDYWTQVSNVTFNDVQATYLNKIQQFHGNPELEISVAAEVAQLKDQFAALADSPEDAFLQRTTVDQAVLVANKINDLSNLITEMRNDAQDEMSVSVTNINQKLAQIADLNHQIKFNKAVGKTTAALEDQRDKAVKELSEEMEVSFFIRGDGVMVVQTSSGVQLADERAEEVFFSKSAIGPTSAYPDSANGIYVGGNPAANPVAIEITRSGLNGKIGALIDLRDNVLPTQQALADELAHKLAVRFDAQGLRLFTDGSGGIPADTAPDPSTDPPTPVAYVGFAAEIQVNAAIIADNSLVQQGTVPTDLPVQQGSNEVIRRVVQYVFGDVNYQEAAGNVNLLASGAGQTLQNWLGVFSQNQVTGTSSMETFSSLGAMMAGAPNIFQPPLGPVTDQFSITFSDARTGLPAQTYIIDLSDIQADPDFIGLPNAGEQIAAAINGLYTTYTPAAGSDPLPPDAGFDVQASVNGYGQLVIESRANITIDATFAGGMGQDGLDYLGLTEGTYNTTDPYLDIQIGNDPPVRVTIEPGEDETDFLAKLDKITPVDAGVPGLAVEIDGVSGFLTLRPGDDINNPTFGGDIKILGGPFRTDGSGTIPGGIAANTTLVQALFGTNSPISSVGYSSPTATVGVNVTFRSQNLGPGADINTGIISSANLIDYAQKLVNRQSEEINAIEARSKDEASFRDLLQRRLLDESGVNLDEELSNLITIQTAYAAAARVVTAIGKQFDDLLAAVI
jgi:flagellar hook-associated protein 1 FlgK